MKRRKPRPKPRLRPKPRELPAGMATLTDFFLDAGTAVSTPLNATTGTISALIMPMHWTPTSLTFQVSFDGDLWLDLYDSRGLEVILPAHRGGVLIDWSERLLFKNVWLRLRSGTSGTPEPQPVDCTFTAVIVP